VVGLDWADASRVTPSRTRTKRKEIVISIFYLSVGGHVGVALAAEGKTIALCPLMQKSSLSASPCNLSMPNVIRHLENRCGGVEDGTYRHNKTCLKERPVKERSPSYIEALLASQGI
jgi:hypothetical protein